MVKAFQKPVKPLYLQWSSGFLSDNKDKCAACYMCVMNCRCGVPAISPDRKRMIKYDFRAHLEEGPACVRVCPRRAVEVREV